MNYSGEVVSFVSLWELPLLRASCPPGFPATRGNVQRPPHCSRQPGLTSAWAPGIPLPTSSLRKVSALCLQSQGWSFLASSELLRNAQESSQQCFSFSWKGGGRKWVTPTHIHTCVQSHGLTFHTQASLTRTHTGSHTPKYSGSHTQVHEHTHTHL